MANVLPLNIFPGFTAHGLISDQVREIATVFNAEGVEALTAIPEQSVAWADLGSRYTPGMIDVKVPVRLTSLLGFEPFEGERKFHQVNVSSVAVRPAPYSLGLEWPIQLTQAGIPQLVEFYGVQGLANDVVSHARALKADLVASLMFAGFTNASLGLTAKALTLPQPGYPSGLPLFTDGTATPQHYSNPLDSRSSRFSNLFYNAGKITDSGVLGTCLYNMSKVPHPSKANMTLGLGVTDFVGGTAMLPAFIQAAVQSLSLQTTTSPASLAAATTNPFTPDHVQTSLAYVNASGLTPYRFHIAPQLDAHPYVVANPGKQMWFAISQSRPSLKWCEMAGPNATFAPMITLLGDGTEEARKSRKVRMFGDLDAGAAAGLPHSVQMYTESTP